MNENDTIRIAHLAEEERAAISSYFGGTPLNPSDIDKLGRRLRTSSVTANGSISTTEPIAIICESPEKDNWSIVVSESSDDNSRTLRLEFESNRLSQFLILESDNFNFLSDSDKGAVLWDSESEEPKGPGVEMLGKEYEEQINELRKSFEPLFENQENRFCNACGWVVLDEAVGCPECSPIAATLSVPKKKSPPPLPDESTDGDRKKIPPLLGELSQSDSGAPILEDISKRAGDLIGQIWDVAEDTSTKTKESSPTSENVESISGESPTPTLDSESPSCVEGKTKFCTSCGTNLVPEARFCSQCGVPQEPQCPNCSEKTKPNAKFCTRCGTGLNA